MSSLKNLVKTRTYRERSQPKARAKLGMLEKHKDYKLRAVDFHRKEDALQKMKEKAALKNPDEFYFNMVRTKKVPPSRPPRPPAAAARMPLRRMPPHPHAAASPCAQVDGVHQKQAKPLATESEMDRFTKEDIGYLAMKQVSEGKVRAPLRPASERR